MARLYTRHVQGPAERERVSAALLDRAPLRAALAVAADAEDPGPAAGAPRARPPVLRQAERASLPGLRRRVLTEILPDLQRQTVREKTLLVQVQRGHIREGHEQQFEEEFVKIPRALV